MRRPGAAAGPGPRPADGGGGRLSGRKASAEGAPREDELSRRYWWHRHRAAAVVQAAERFSPRPLPGRYLDLGCGPGASTRRVWDGLIGVGLASAGDAAPLGLDADERARPFCERNGVDFRPWSEEAALDALPEAAFGFITALDIVDGLEQPRPFMEAVRRRLAPGAVFVLTAPARRRLGELRLLCRAGGLRVLWSSGLFSYGLLPSLGAGRGRAAGAALDAMSAVERAALRLFPLPLGASAMVVAAR